MTISPAPASRLPRSLAPGKPYMWRHCIECGHEFPTQAINAMFCSGKCAMRTFRARATLAGTHRWVGRRFMRIDLREVGA